MYMLVAGKLFVHVFLETNCYLVGSMVYMYIPRIVIAGKHRCYNLVNVYVCIYIPYYTS